MLDIVKEKERIVVSYFISHPEAYISEISTHTGISKSSVQRYLKKYGSISLADGKTINDQLSENQRRGQHQGGVQSFKKNDFIKDEQGHFAGSVSSVSDVDKEAKKREDIKRICICYLDNKSYTLDELASLFYDLYGYTRDYVYDCLLDSSVPEVIGEEKSREIEINLSHNRTSFCRKLLEAEVDLNQIPTLSGLTELEECIFMERLQNPEISLDEVAASYHLSRAAVIKHENKAISKISQAIGREK